MKKACIKENEESVREDIKSYKKMKALQDEIIKGNEYFFRETLYNARILFRFRAEIFEAKKNFSHKPEYKREKFLCDSCESEIDENTHVLFCHAYKSLRDNISINNDTQLAHYLYKVLQIRSKLRLTR